MTSDTYSPLALLRLPESLNQKTIWAGHVARMEAKKNAYKDLVGKP
jgi:hypothetical protein